MVPRKIVLTMLLISVSTVAEDNAEYQGDAEEVVERTRSLEAQNIRLEDMECEGDLADEELKEWNIRYGSYGGWTSFRGVRIWSNGQAAICKDRACDKYSVCSSLRARPEMLDSIGEKISRMPACSAEKATVRISAQCSDHSEHMIEVEVGNRYTAFSYAIAKGCRKEDVPTWMVELTEVMRTHVEWVRRCEVND